MAGRYLSRFQGPTNQFACTRCWPVHRNEALKRALLASRPAFSGAMREFHRIFTDAFDSDDGKGSLAVAGRNVAALPRTIDGRWCGRGRRQLPAEFHRRSPLATLHQGTQTLESFRKKKINKPTCNEENQIQRRVSSMSGFSFQKRKRISMLWLRSYRGLRFDF